MLQMASTQDREAVNALAIQVHNLHVAWRPDLFCTTDLLYDENRFVSAVRDRQLFVAKVDGMIAGYALLPVRFVSGPGLVPRKELIIQELCVEESVRCMGIGTQMISEIRLLAKAFGCTHLVLSAEPQNEGALAFYRKCGFTLQNVKLYCEI